MSSIVLFYSKYLLCLVDFYSLVYTMFILDFCILENCKEFNTHSNISSYYIRKESKKIIIIHH